MNKILKGFVITFLLAIIVFSSGCRKCGKDKLKVEEISVITETIPTEILTTEIDDKIDDIKIKVVKRNGDEETININKSMIADSDYAKLSTAGTYTITVTYKECTTSLTITVKTPKQNDDGGNGDDPVKPDPISYSVLIKDIAGKPLSDFYIMFYKGKDVVAEGYTNLSGTFEESLLPDKYDVVIEGKDGYYLNQEMYETDLIGSQIEVTCEIDSLEGIEASEDVSYTLGDVMYDFTLTDIEGNELKLYELLETKKAVILNFWYTTCSACYYEFPYMIDAYESTYVDSNGETRKYSDDIAIIAVNPGFAGDGDTLAEIINFAESMGLNFNVALDYDRDESSITLDPALTLMFGVKAYPTTVIIDSYGLIAEIGEGSVTDTSKWTQTFDKYLAEDYYPKYTGYVEQDAFVEPDIEQAPSSELEEAVNGNNYDGNKFNGTYHPEDNENDAKYSWPWIVETFKGKTCIKPSNKDQNPSFSIVYVNVHMKEGEVFTFDYFASTEEYDTLYVIVDGTIATQIAGMSPDWETSYAFSAIEDGDYEIALCYMKDASYSQGEDAVYLTNIRIVRNEDINKETYIFREASYGVVNEFTMSWSKYITPVYNEEDGYYHVDDVNGPLLLADMLSGTHWNASDLYSISIEGKCIGADGIDYNDLIEEYAVYASNSSVGYTPITKELADALKQIVKALGDNTAANNPNQWLEVCVYYSAYGTDGVELGIPTTGVCPWEPIMFDGDGINAPATAGATYDRIILPRGFIFGFTPVKSGVYKFYSTEEVLETIGWICDENGNAIADTDYGLRVFAEQVTKGEPLDMNFEAYIYLEEGKTYLFRAAFYDIYEYSEITVSMEYLVDKLDLLTIASPGLFTSTDDEMTNIISGNYVDFELQNDGYYHVKDSLAKDTFVYCDVLYVNNIMQNGMPIKDLVEHSSNPFDFSKNEFGYAHFDEEGYYRAMAFDENNEKIIRYYVCYDAEGNEYLVEEIGENGYTEENGYTYYKLTQEEIEAMNLADCTEYVRNYIQENMITDENSELYGCVKVDEQFGKVLELLMDKYTFAGVEYSWAKLCYYYKYVGPVDSK